MSVRLKINFIIFLIALSLLGGDESHSAVPESLPLKIFEHPYDWPLQAMQNGGLLFSSTSNKVNVRQLNGWQLTPPNELSFTEGFPVEVDSFGLHRQKLISGTTYYQHFAPPLYDLGFNIPMEGQDSMLNIAVGERWCILLKCWSNTNISSWPTDVQQQGTYLWCFSKESGQSYNLFVGTTQTPFRLIKGISIDGDLVSFLETKAPDSGILQASVFDLNTRSLLWSAGGVPSWRTIHAMIGNVLVLAGDPRTQIRINGNLVFMPMAHPADQVEIPSPSEPIDTVPNQPERSISKIVRAGEGLWIFYTGSGSRDLFSTRHFSLDPEDRPVLDFVGKWPEPYFVPSQSIRPPLSFAADDERAMVCSSGQSIALFDRKRDLPVLEIANVEAGESQGGVTVTARLDRITTTDVSFRILPGIGSAKIGEDLIDFDQVVSIEPGKDRVSWWLPFLRDSTAERDEAIRVNISMLTGVVSAQSDFQVGIREQGYKRLDGLRVKALPAGAALGELSCYGKKGFLAAEKISGELMAFSSDGSFLYKLSGSNLSYTSGFTELDDGSWSCLATDPGSPAIRYINWNPANGSQRTILLLTPYGMSATSSLLILRSGRLLAWSEGAEALEIDPIQSTSRTFPLSSDDLVPSIVRFAEGKTVVVAGGTAWMQGTESTAPTTGPFLTSWAKGDLTSVCNLNPLSPQLAFTSISGIVTSGDVAYLKGPNGAIDLLSGLLLWGDSIKRVPISDFPSSGNVLAGQDGCFVFEHRSYRTGDDAGFDVVDAFTGFLLDGFRVPGVTGFQITLGDGMFILTPYGPESRPLSFTMILSNVPAIIGRLSSALPGNGALLTVGWASSYQRGTTVFWKITQPTGSKLPNEFALKSGSVVIPAQGSTEVLIPMRPQFELASWTEPLQVELSTPGSGDPPEILALTAPVLDGYEQVTASEDLTPNGSGFLFYDRLSGEGRWLVGRTSRLSPGRSVMRGELDVFDSISGQRVQTIIPPADDEESYFGANFKIAGNRILVSAPYSQSGTPETMGSVFIYGLETGALVARIRNPLRVSGFGETLATNDNLFAVGAPGNLPFAYRNVRSEKAGFALYRWSDLKRITTKVTSNESLGKSLEFTGNNLLVGAPYANSIAGRARLQGAGIVYSFDSTTKKLVALWKPATPIQNGRFGERITVAQDAAWVTGGFFASSGAGRQNGLWGYSLLGPSATYSWPPVDGKTPPTVLYEVSKGTSMVLGSLLSFTDLKSGSFFGSIKLVSGADQGQLGQCLTETHLYWIYAGRLYRTPRSTLGSFKTWSRLNQGDQAIGKPGDDVDSNGQADFDDYLDYVVNQNAPYVEAVVSGDGQTYRFSQKRPIPSDTVASLQIQIPSGEWVNVALKEGSDSWRTLDRNPWNSGLSGDYACPQPSAAPLARVVLLPHPTIK